MSVMLASAYRSSRPSMTVLRCAISRLAASEGHFWTEATYLQQTRSFQSRNERISVGLGRIWSKREKSDSAEPPAGTRDNVAFNLPRRVREKVVTASDAVSLVRNGDTIAVTGFVAQGCPEYVVEALGKRYEESGQPHSLTLLFGGGPGDWDSKGLNHFAKTKPEAPGMLHRTIGSHYGQTPKVADLVINNQVEAWTLPMGSISRMVRAQATHSPGHLTSVGLGTFIDPDIRGGAVNERALESPLHSELVSHIELGGVKQLCYKALPVNVAIIRATTSDPQGNLTMEDESLLCDHKITAAAAKNSGGIVIAQVKRIAQSGSLPTREVAVPGALVDCVVVVPEELHEEKHPMSYFKVDDPVLACKLRTPANAMEKMPLDIRKVIARRAAFFLKPGDIVNLGIGMPEGVAAVADEEGMLDFVTLTTEAGMFGGKPESGHQFGPARNASACLEMNQMFDFYDGGGLDSTFLGAAQISARGDVNVSRLTPTRLTGPGGFIDISQSTGNVAFVCPFTSNGTVIELPGDGTLKVKEDGKVKKFVSEVSEITFSGDEAVRRGQKVYYITERAVFGRTAKYDVLELIEIAPGVDLQKDILDQMDFEPVISKNLKVMDSRLFSPSKMGMLEDLFGNILDRCVYHEEDHTLFMDLFGVSLYSEDDVSNFMDALKQILLIYCSDKGPVRMIINYDGFDLGGGLEDIYSEGVNKLKDKYYASVTRFSGSAFHRAKLGKVFETWDLEKAFDEFDANSDGKLSVEELRHGMKERFGIRMTERELKSLTDDTDLYVTRDQFRAFMLKALKSKFSGSS